MKKIPFKGRIGIIGYGSVSRCFLPILLKHVTIPTEKISIVDYQNKEDDLSVFISTGLTYVRTRITRENLGDVLSPLVGAGDLLIDLGYGIGANDIIGWCHDRRVLYLNTSTEVWDTEDELLKCPILRKTLYHRHMNLEKMVSNWDRNSTTAIIEHGVNPGIISSLVKKGLADIAGELLNDPAVKDPCKEQVHEQLSALNFPGLARNLGVKVIHCSERDTQIHKKPKMVDEFVGTWSVEGFREEATACAELGWGTHEDTLPAHAHAPESGPKNQIFLARMGLNTLIRSWVPYQEFVGMLIRHGEAYTLSKYLTVFEDDRAVYRPTVYYAYLPCDSAIASIQEFRGRGYKMQSQIRILSDEIVTGKDTLGALLLGHRYNAWWTGSILDIGQARKLVKGQNATTVQVAIGVMAATLWMIEHPENGFCVPDDLPYDYILDIAKPYLGEFVSVQSDWTPAKNYNRFFRENPDSAFNKNLWSFENFLCQE